MAVNSVEPLTFVPLELHTPSSEHDESQIDLKLKQLSSNQDGSNLNENEYGANDDYDDDDKSSLGDNSSLNNDEQDDVDDDANDINVDENETLLMKLNDQVDESSEELIESTEHEIKSSPAQISENERAEKPAAVELLPVLSSDQKSHSVNDGDMTSLRNDKLIITPIELVPIDSDAMMIIANNNHNEMNSNEKSSLISTMDGDESTKAKKNFNYQNLNINKVDSYVELRYKRCSSGNFSKYNSDALLKKGSHASNKIKITKYDGTSFSSDEEDDYGNYYRNGDGNDDGLEDDDEEAIVLSKKNGGSANADKKRDYSNLLKRHKVPYYKLNMLSSNVTTSNLSLSAAKTKTSSTASLNSSSSSLSNSSNSSMSSLSSLASLVSASAIFSPSFLIDASTALRLNLKKSAKKLKTTAFSNFSTLSNSSATANSSAYDKNTNTLLSTNKANVSKTDNLNDVELFNEMKQTSNGAKLLDEQDESFEKSPKKLHKHKHNKSISSTLTSNTASLDMANDSNRANYNKLIKNNKKPKTKSNVSKSNKNKFKKLNEINYLSKSSSSLYSITTTPSTTNTGAKHLSGKKTMSSLKKSSKINSSTNNHQTSSSPSKNPNDVMSSLATLNNYSTISLNAKKLKLLLVGDASTGKSTMACSFLKRVFQREYHPTIVDNYEVKVNSNGEAYTLSLFDTAGQEDWETLRIMAYPDTDVIILCFSVVRPDSMENIKTKWVPELNKYLPDALIILVGTQVDLRNEHHQSNQNGNGPRTAHITTREGEELRQRINAYKYIECSALTQLNINEVFDSCIQAYVDKNKKVQPSCFSTLLRSFTRSIRTRFNFYSPSRRSQRSDSNTLDSHLSGTKSPKKVKKEHEQ